MTKEVVLNAIKASGENGLKASDLKELVGNEGLWINLNSLYKNNEIFVRKDDVNRYVAIEYITEDDLVAVPKKEKGAKMDKQFVDTMTKDIVEKVLNGLKPKEETPAKQDMSKINVELPPCFKSILSYATHHNAVMLTGPAGTGKGYLARQVAKVVGAEFYEVNAVKNSYDLTGFVDANSRFVRTPFYDACKAIADGKKAVFLFDEMDCSDPEVLKIFNEALSSLEFTFPNDEHLTFDDLIILCACNTFGTGSDEMYCGEQLDASTLDRFAMVHVDYNRKVEMNIAKGDEELVDFIDAFRRQTEKNGLLFVASYRSLKRIVSMKGGDIPLKQVMKECFIKSMADDDLKMVLDNMSDKENLYWKACKGENVKWIQQGELELTA